MTSIINEFRVSHLFPKQIIQKIKLFHVFESDFAICVTNDDKVYAFGKNNLIQQYLGYKEEEIENDYVLISELCDQKIEQFFCFFRILFAKSSNNKIFGSGFNSCGQLARGYKSVEYLKPKRIEFFDNKNIIDISSGQAPGGCCHCLALSSEGLVYGWGDNQFDQFDNTRDNQGFLIPVLINNKFGVEKRMKHIHSHFANSVMVSFNGFVYLLNPDKQKWNNLNYLSRLKGVQKIYLYFNGAVILRNWFIQYISHNSSSEKINVQGTVDCIYYYQNLEEVIINSNEPKSKIISNNNDKLGIKEKNAFEYCLQKHQSTFKTIHIDGNQIHSKNVEFNENRNYLFQSTNNICFNLNEYKERLFNQEHSINLRKFRIFNTLPEILDSKVKYYHQFREYDSDYYSAIYVMNDNKVYGIGFNLEGILGLGHKKRISKYTSIPELCDQNIEEFFEGRGYIFARSKENQIFSWGDNFAGKLARRLNTKTRECLKPKKLKFFQNKNIIEISCAFSHCLALSKDGLIYGWGYNEWGETGVVTNYFQVKPERVKLFDKTSDKRIKFIHCSNHTSCAVTVDGRAYLWGLVNWRKTVIPILIEAFGTGISKMYLHISNYSVFSVLTNNGIFRHMCWVSNNDNDLYSMRTIVESEGVVDIYGLNTVLKEDAVYEVNEENKRIKKTIYSNFYEYYLYKKKEIKETIHVTNDGYLKRPKLESNEELLNKKFVNIFDRKLENSFTIIEEIGEGGSGVVFKVRSKSTDALYAIKRMRMKGKKKSIQTKIQ